MKLRKNKSAYKMPPYHRVENVVLDTSRKNPEGVRYCLMHTPYQTKKDKKVGLPTYFSMHGDKIEFFPTPDAGYEVEITYSELKRI